MRTVEGLPWFLDCTQGFRNGFLRNGRAGYWVLMKNLKFGIAGLDPRNTQAMRPRIWKNFLAWTSGNPGNWEQIFLHKLTSGLRRCLLSSQCRPSQQNRAAVPACMVSNFCDSWCKLGRPRHCKKVLILDTICLFLLPGLDPDTYRILPSEL